MNTKLNFQEAEVSTTTIDKNKVDAKTDNIYEAISIVAKRSNQINTDLKKELIEKLEEFATHNDSLEEVFENKEQIEVSKFYERLPKPHAIAMDEWLKDKIYYRHTNQDDTSI
jgi:DNA-directed RNA polymerase subunit K/omega